MLTKLSLRSAQEGAELRGCLLQTWLLDSSCNEVKMMEEQGRAYQIAIRKKGKGHPYGAPNLWIYAALIQALLKRGDSIGARTKTNLQAHWEELDNMDTEDKAEIIRVCRLDRVYAEGKRRLTFYLAEEHDPDKEPIRKSINTAMGQVPGTIRKVGKSPATFMERDLQQWLEVLEQ